MQPTNEHVRINYPFWNFELSICHLHGSSQAVQCLVKAVTLQKAAKGAGKVWVAQGESPAVSEEATLGQVPTQILSHTMAMYM